AIGASATIGTSIDSQRSGTSISAQSGRRNLKNNGLQRIFSAPFTTNRTTTVMRSALVAALRHARKAASEASARITDQAGPNNQSGGCHDGLRNVWYHGDNSVSHAPIPATAMPHSAATTISAVMPKQGPASARGPSEKRAHVPSDQYAPD